MIKFENVKKEEFQKVMYIPFVVIIVSFIILYLLLIKLITKTNYDLRIT